MLLKKSSFFKMILAALLLTNVVGCKKSNINTPPNDITNQPNYQFEFPLTSFITTPHLFINYIPQSSNSNQLAAYNLSIADQKTALTNNFYASNNGKGNALMNTYVASVDEIWGVRFDPSLNKTVLTRLSLKNKINTDVSIFPADKLVRKIIGVDEILKKIYYLEGGENSITYNKLIRCNWDGTAKEELYADPINMLDAAIDIIGKKLYVVNKSLNALACVDLNTKAVVSQLSNFNIMAKDQKLNLQQAKLVPFALDLTSKKVFWLKENLLNKNKYGLNGDRPDLMVADVDGKTLKINLGVYFYKNSIADDKTIIGPFGFTVTYNKGVINIDPANKKLYILSQYKIATESGEPGIILPEYIPTTILEINYNNLPPIWKNLTPEKNGLQAFNNLWESYPDGLKGFVFVKHRAAN